MGTIQEPGPVGARVGANVKALREAAGMSVRGLANRMGELGRPLLASGVHKVEQGERRVDSDELVAFAIALGVTPNRLLLQEEARGYRIPLTAAVTARAIDAWRWATGERPLQPHNPEPGEVERFSRANRPHNPIRPVYAHEWRENLDKIRPLNEVMGEMMRQGVPFHVIQDCVAMLDTRRTNIAIEADEWTAEDGS